MDRVKISISELSKSFADHQVLKKANLSIYDQEIFFIIGKSGSGKSVLLKNIATLMKPDNGRVFIDSKDLFALSSSQLDSMRKKIGFLFQMSALFDSVSIFDNVAFFLKRFTKKSAEEIKYHVHEKLKMVGLKNIENKIPSELSGGMQKRVALARVIITEPEILLYDEPTTGVDPISASAVNDLIYRLNGEMGVTSVVVSHDIKSAMKLAHRISMLYGGEFILTGEPKEFIESDNLLIQEFIHGKSEKTNEL